VSCWKRFCDPKEAGGCARGRALQGGLGQPATTGNFEIRVNFELSLLPSPTSLSTQAKKLRRLGF